MEKVELKRQDASGRIQFVHALPKEKIIEKLKDIDTNLYEYVKTAWKIHFPGFVDTVAVLDLETGKVRYAHSTDLDPNFDTSVPLFIISHRTSADISCDDLYTDDEIEEIRRMIYLREIEEPDEYAEKTGIDLDQRYAECLLVSIREDKQLGFIYSELTKEIDRIYENETN